MPFDSPIKSYASSFAFDISSYYFPVVENDTLAFEEEALLLKLLLLLRE